MCKGDFLRQSSPFTREKLVIFFQLELKPEYEVPFEPSSQLLVFMDVARNVALLHLVGWHPPRQADRAVD